MIEIPSLDQNWIADDVKYRVSIGSAVLEWWGELQGPHQEALIKLAAMESRGMMPMTSAEYQFRVYIAANQPKKPFRPENLKALAKAAAAGKKAKQTRRKKRGA